MASSKLNLWHEIRCLKKEVMDATEILHTHLMDLHDNVKYIQLTANNKIKWFLRFQKLQVCAHYISVHKFWNFHKINHLCGYFSLGVPRSKEYDNYIRTKTKAKQIKQESLFCSPWSYMWWRPMPFSTLTCILLHHFPTSLFWLFYIGLRLKHIFGSFSCCKFN